VTGGVPGYHFALTSGSLPSGLFLDSFTGTISGVPGQAGVFPVTLQLQDNDRTSPAVSKPFLLIVTPVEHAASQTDPGKIKTASDTLVLGGSYSVKR
jgi:hypothetical protein